MNVVEYIIRAKDATASGIRSALDKVKSFGTSVGKNLMNIKAGLDMLGAAARNAVAFMRKAFAFETMTVQFKTLVGSMDEARQHMAMLQRLGENPPFAMEQFASASRTLMVMTDNVLGFKDSLELVGNAAAATGQSIDSLAHHVGLAFASIRDGAPISRATFALRSMGAITPAVAEKLEELQRSGASTTEIWQTLEDHLKRFEGAMKETESTGDGLIGAISSQWDNSLRTFGAALLETTKDGLGALLDKMKELNEDGTLVSWAAKVAEAINDALDALKEFYDKLHEVQSENRKDVFDRSGAGEGWQENIAQFFGNAWAGLGATGAWIRGAVMPGEHAMENYRAYAALHGYGSWADENARQLSKWANENGMWQGDVDIRDVEDKRIEAIKTEAARETAKKKAEAEEKEAEKAEQKAKKKQEVLAEGQRKLDEKNAKIKAEKEAEEARKAAEAAEKEAEKQRQKEEQDRLKMEQKIAAARQRYLQKELSDRQKEEQEAQTALAEAQQKVRQAWGWYRDKDSLKAQLEEEKAEAEAQKQYEKDFERLRWRRRDWRTADNLSLDDEAVRRVALAKEEEESAQQAVQQTAENTRRAADALEALLAAEEEGE